MVVLFACRRGRLRDIALLRLGTHSAGHDFSVAALPWALPKLLAAALMRLLGADRYLILSDKFPGDTLIARMFGSRCTRMLWNYADEWPAKGTRLPRHRVCFFREAGQDADVFPFAPQPQPQPAVSRNTPSRPIVFVGDVTVDLPIQRGAAWWSDRFRELHEAFGYTFYLQPEYEALIAQQLERPVDRRLARVLGKNLLRLWIVQAVHERFGERLVLVGSNWRRFEMASLASLYDESQRLDFYRSAVVNLDCASKSGDLSLYPRSSELVSFAGGLLQVRCSDTDAVFGERAPEFTFATRAELFERLDGRLAEPLERRRERDAWLAGRLCERRLLMQHSIQQVLEGPRDLPPC